MTNALVQRYVFSSLFLHILQDVTITVEWLKDRGLMPNTRTCSRCGPLVRLELSRAQRTRHWQTYDQLVWLCHNCDQSIYLRQVVTNTLSIYPFSIVAAEATSKILITFWCQLTGTCKDDSLPSKSMCFRALFSTVHSTFL